MSLNPIVSPKRRLIMDKEGGVTLIEVLVAVVVLAIGLLGLASLQVVGQRSNHSAYLRSQAVLQAYDMADRMRANFAGVRNGGYDSISSTPSNPGCITSGCTPLQLAQYDAMEWNTMNQQVLPSGQGTVAIDNATGTFTITIAWDENRDGSVDNNDPDFSLEVRI